ncbi:MAG TPA: hypothetical protein VNP98_16865 [Chthoniobacterales bacterium]|nr:hypothetical protein [Chthoniobacterales bacterium]
MSEDSGIIRQLEDNLAKLRAEYAGSWALHTKDDFELGFAREIKTDLQSTLMKWAVGAVVLLFGAGAVFIKYSVSQTFQAENERLVKEFYRKYEAQLDLLRDNFEWRRFHDYGKDYVYLAQLYFDSPVESPLKAKKVTENLVEAEKYFRSALQHGDMHASTYWELAELLFTYPQQYQVSSRIDAIRAISQYEQAGLRYTKVEIDKGWRAEVYLRSAEACLYLADANHSPADNRARAKEFLLKANTDYANLKDQTATRDRKNIDRVNELLSALR